MIKTHALPDPDRAVFRISSAESAVAALYSTMFEEEASVGEIVVSELCSLSDAAGSKGAMVGRSSLDGAETSVAASPSVCLFADGALSEGRTAARPLSVLMFLLTKSALRTIKWATEILFCCSVPSLFIDFSTGYSVHCGWTTIHFLAYFLKFFSLQLSVVLSDHLHFSLPVLSNIMNNSRLAEQRHIT